LVIGITLVLFVLVAGVVFAAPAGTPPSAGTYTCKNATRWISIIIEDHQDGPRVKTVSLIRKDYNEVITNRVYFDGSSQRGWIPTNNGGGGTYTYIDSNSFSFGSDVYVK
jgi:hypothetical protein